VLAERYNDGRIADKVFCYVGGGWYCPGQTVKDLQDEMRRHLDAGYTMVKMKVGVSRSPRTCARRGRQGDAARRCQLASMPIPSSRATRPRLCQGARAVPLRWFEEPCDPLDFALLAEIARHYEPPLSTGENLFSTQDVENLIRFGGLRPDRNDRDPGRSPAILRHRAIRAHYRHAGAPRMAAQRHCSRTGGNQMSLAMAAGFGLGGAESYPGVFGAFGGFADDARLDGGYLTLSDRPGIGFEGQSALYALMRDLAA
jgi:L-alanine-DL-glutamate epimerase-like enolase superfamily enzyme